MIRFGRGDFIPWFEAETNKNPRFQFETLAGNIVPLTLFETSKDPKIGRLIERLSGLELLEQPGIMWFGCSADAEDIAIEAGLYRPPRLRCFIDGTGSVHRGLRTFDEESGTIVPQTLLLGPKLRVLDGQVIEDPDKHVDWLIEAITREREREQAVADSRFAPVLLIDDILEPVFCRKLISLYEEGDPGESGFMEVKDGKTVGRIDHSFKRRKDYKIQDESIRRALRNRINARLVPAIERAFSFKATRIERYIVACYDGADGGHFRAHRDNTTPGTAHRRFAVTINLNAEDYEGGELCFPEFGPRSYRAPTGGAVVFCCSLQHRAMPVTSGVRYCTLPFLYGDNDASVREANKGTIVPAKAPADGDAVDDAPEASPADAAE